MRKSLQFFMLFFATVLFQACEGPEGKLGPQGDPGPTGVAGPTGPAGPSTPSQVFDFQVSFTAANNYGPGIGFAQNDIIVGEDDVVLSYMYIYTAGTQQAPIALWSPMPQLFFVTDKPVKYNSAYNSTALYLILETSTEMKATLAGNTALKTEYLDNQIFRAVVIPGKGVRMANGAKKAFDPKDYPVDFNNYEEVIKYFKISDKNVPMIKVN